jgi:hypothetical protein
MFNSQNKKGFVALYMVVLILVIIFGIGMSVFILTYREQKISRNITRSTQAYYVAEAGIEDSIYRILKGKNYEATNQLIVGDGLTDISISSDDSIRTIESTGDMAQRIRKLKTTLTIEATVITFHYGAQVDRGGLIIRNNATVYGNVYSNGNIQGADVTSEITGDAWVAGGIAPNPDQKWTVQDSDFPFGLKSGGEDYIDTAQSFIPSETKFLNRVSFYIKKVGSPPDQTVRIVTDDGGEPSQTSIGEGTLKASKITSNYSWIDISIDLPPLLTAGQTYWIMIDVSRDDDNHWVWGKDSTDGYPLGTAKYTKDWTKAVTVWSPAGGDLNFKTWTGGIITYIDKTTVGVDAHANTITDSAVGRDAYYQYIENTSVGGTSYPGSPDPALKDLSISYAQIQEWEKGACCDTGAGCQPTCVYVGDYTPLDGSSIGPIKIEGDLIFPQNGTVTIEGPVWVTGNILATNNVIIKLKESLTSGYAIIADNPSDQANYGKIELSNNVFTQDSPEGGYLLFVSTNTSLSDLDPSIWLFNNVNKDLAQSIIFSLQGLIKVENNAKFKEITGFSIYLSNNAEIVYDSGLINAAFSTGPGGGWDVADWQEVE